MKSQRSLTSGGYERMHRATQCEHFLEPMDAVVPSLELVAVIAPMYPVAGNGRPQFYPLGNARISNMTSAR